MIHADCVVCGRRFRKLGRAVTCGRECSRIYGNRYVSKWITNSLRDPDYRKKWNDYQREYKRRRRAADPNYGRDQG